MSVEFQDRHNILGITSYYMWSNSLVPSIFISSNILLTCPPTRPVLTLQSLPSSSLPHPTPICYLKSLVPCPLSRPYSVCYLMSSIHYLKSLILCSLPISLPPLSLSSIPYPLSRHSLTNLPTHPPTQSLACSHLSILISLDILFSSPCLALIFHLFLVMSIL